MALLKPHAIKIKLTALTALFFNYLDYIGINLNINKMVSQIIKLAELKEIERILRNQLIYLVNNMKLSNTIRENLLKGLYFDLFEINKQESDKKKTEQLIRLIQRLKRIESIKKGYLVQL